MIGEQVRVYYSLHRRRFSVQRKVDGRWLVDRHADALELVDVEFKVSEAGRQRVIEQRRKNVHAFVVGRLAVAVPATPNRLTYNPYRAGTFVSTADGSAVTSAPYARLTNDGRPVVAVAA